MQKYIATVIAAGLMLSSGAALSLSAPNDANRLERQTAQSDLIFKGTITAIEYRNSTEGVPHTFVTYRVDNVVKGTYGARTLTLRFVGGVQKKGVIVRTLVASNAPAFATGQQDLLMMRGNGEVSCPLVQCALGRYRMEQGRVKTEVGGVIAKSNDGGAVVLSGGNARIASGGQAVKLSDGAIATPYSQAEFISLVRNVASQQRSSATRAKPIRSMDPSRPFNGTLPNVAAAPPSR